MSYTRFMLPSSSPPGGPKSPLRSSTHESSMTRDVSRQIYVQNLRTPTSIYIATAVTRPIVKKKSIAYSQALRLRKICHRDLDYQRHITDLKTYLVQRGYNDEEVQFQLNKASGLKRSDLLTPKPRKAEQITPLVVTFHPDLPYLCGLLRECHCLFNVSQRLKGALPKPPFVVYRRPPNLRNLLVRAALRKSRHTYMCIMGMIDVANHDVKRVRILKQASRFAAPPPTRSFV